MRQDPVFRAEEQMRNTLAHQERRRDPTTRQVDQEASTSNKRMTRLQARMQRERRLHLSQSRVQAHRYVTENRILERNRENSRNRRRREEQSPEERQDELQRQQRIRKSNSFKLYSDRVKEGPTEICVCCGGSWFPHKTKKLVKPNIERNHPSLNSDEVFFLKEKFPSRLEEYKFCSTCHRAVASGKLPAICLSKGLDFPTVPNCLKDLTCLEERLISPRIPFMRIISLGYERQCAVRGAVVNIPISVVETVTALPRTFNNAHVIQVHLKRRLEYDHSFMTETIRPAKILEALRYLMDTELYRKYNISITEDWINNVGHGQEVPFIADASDEATARELIARRNEDNEADNLERQEELNPGGLETLLDNEIIENFATERVALAPGEGRLPSDVTMDEDAEELSYPTIYCGQKRNCVLSYSKIARSEVRRYDRRCTRIDKLLWTYKFYELSRIKSAISICLRKKSGSNSITAGNVLDEAFVGNLEQHDDGYRILRGLRSSPAHWEAEKKKLLSMIRQVGLPTFFITLSAAETKWSELLIILSKLVDKVDRNQEEVDALSSNEKARLIRSDPVTCSRYFDNRFRNMVKLFKNGIFDEYTLSHYYWRIEFQHRGSPHSHGMYWLSGAPQFDASNSRNTSHLVSFIDRFITTNGRDEEIADLLQYQKHSHARSCLRELNGQKFCRYNMPYPPMPETEVLYPLEEHQNNLAQHKENFKKIKDFLNSSITDEQAEFMDEFNNILTHTEMNYEEYKLAIRSSLLKPQIFLSRKFSDRMLNAYNKDILRLHRANIDIQFILDAYACCGYVINYINKSNRGVSKLLRQAMDEINAGNFSIKRKLQHIGNKFINGTEISGQEAAYNILGLHLSEASHGEVFINTSHPEKRVRMVKARKDLMLLTPNSNDIFVPNLLDHYIQRPDDLEQLCLADFAALYKYAKSNRRNAAQNEEYGELEAQEEETMDRESWMVLKNDSGYIKQRARALILRWRKFSVNTHRADYFRETAMLFIPWRCEQTELIDADTEQLCLTNAELIQQGKQKYDVFKDGELEAILQEMRDENTAEEIDDNNAASQLLDDEYRALAVPEIDRNINILQADTDREANEEVRLIKLPTLITEEDLLTMVRSLNHKQRQYFAHVMQNVIEKKTFYEYVGGGAGVGKSRLISTIYQSLTIRANSIAGSNPDMIKVLLCAPTGKAAFGIGGLTLHSIFSLPVNQSSAALRPLSSDAVNTLHSKLLELQVIIIDEISMVGAKMLSQLDMRLKQVFKNNNYFGEISIMAFGDLKQLSPVGDRWVFQANRRDNYSSIAGTPLWDQFKYFELTEIMRQREDQTFAVALNNMSEGKMTEADVHLLKERMVAEEDVPRDAIHLFFSNADVSHFNSVKLSQIDTEPIISKCKDVVKAANLTDRSKGNILEAVKSFKLSETQGLSYELLLKTSAKYMVTININTSDGLVNGASGELMEVIRIYKSGEAEITTLWIKFSDSSVGNMAKSKKPHPIHDDWTPIEKVVRTFQYKRNEQVNIERKQFPVVPAEAITVHKSQGATYSKVALHVTTRMTRAALYVGCSRATNAAGLFIIGNFNPPRPFLPTDAVQQELVLLRNEKILEKHYDFLHSEDNGTLLFYQNVQSLPAHFNDIQKDQLINSVEILCLVETWTVESDTFQMPGFTLVHGIDRPRTGRNRPAKGMTIYAKQPAATQVLLSQNICTDSRTYQLSAIKYNNFTIVVLYRNSAYPLVEFRQQLISDLRQLLEEQPGKILIVGDFNICRLTTTDRLEDKLSQMGMTALLERTAITTKQLTQIDWVFANGGNATAKTYKTVFSHHDGIFVKIT